MDHVTIDVYASDKQPPHYAWLTQFLKSRFIPKEEFHLWGCDIFHVIYSIVLRPLAMAAPPPRPLAISFDNPSLCFCNEKQHSSRGMTSSVSTGAGTEDATLAEDWIAPTGCCERNPRAVTPTLLLRCAPNTLSFPGKRTWWIRPFITADTTRPSDITINTAQQD